MGGKRSCISFIGKIEKTNKRERKRGNARGEKIGSQCQGKGVHIFGSKVDQFSQKVNVLKKPAREGGAKKKGSATEAHMIPKEKSHPCPEAMVQSPLVLSHGTLGKKEGPTTNREGGGKKKGKLKTNLPIASTSW